MDVLYIEQMIATLETKRDEHCCEKHKKQTGGTCLQRFSRMIDSLKDKLSLSSAPAEPVVTARGDELKKAEKLNAKAEKLEQEHDIAAAKQVKKKARKIVASELNEMDGFPR